MQQSPWHLVKPNKSKPSIKNNPFIKKLTSQGWKKAPTDTGLAVPIRSITTWQRRCRGWGITSAAESQSLKSGKKEMEEKKGQRVRNLEYSYEITDKKTKAQRNKRPNSKNSSNNYNMP
ncbi:hypothetical protein AMTR_s00079p00176960 [Amborella trichopoda]|uniref:Uncharacterized protein n=1 Tax=Amborella trichopoda TaxID=13333 RepID=W1P8M1_AMBTC|nr:hypothetical protein AMTR_s00079p00176960 [Amborella trichopoda]